MLYPFHCVDFSFCWCTSSSWFSWQNSGWYCRHTFMQTATGLHQVWGEGWLTGPYICSKMFYVDAQRACPVCLIILCRCLLVGMDWACPLKGVLFAWPLSLLILRWVVLSKTPSHIWWLYLLTFLFECGVADLMYIDSLIVLAKPWSSLPMMVVLSGLVLCPQ